MALRDLRRRLRATTDDLHHAQLRAQWAVHPTVPIADVIDRRAVCLGGEIQGVGVVPRAGSPSFEVRLHDGTGPAVAIFTGRRSISGMTPGRGLVLEGLAQQEAHVVVLMNPAYTLLA